MHIFIMLITSVQSLKSIACKPLDELITQTCYPTLKANPEIVLGWKCRILSKKIFSSAEIHMHIFNISTTSEHGFKMIHWKL